MSHGNDRDTKSLERKIEATREALGETIDALAQKADVKAQVAAKADQAKQRPAPVVGVIMALVILVLLVWMNDRRRSQRAPSSTAR